MKLILFGGFLGSGKTTVMMSLVSYIIKHSKGNNLPLAIIENEIGKQGIDQNAISSSGINVRTLLAGCICCTLASDLVEAIEEIEKNYSPDYILIEATGLALAHNIIETINQYAACVDSACVCILADYERWNMLKNAMPQLILGQLEGADYVLINKRDKVDDIKAQKIMQDIKENSKNAKLFSICAKEGIADEIWQEVLNEKQ